MVVTLTGANDYVLWHELDQLVNAFINEHGDLAVERLDGQSAELAQLRAVLTALPFLSSHKLVVLRQPSSNKQFGEQAEHIFADVPDTTDVILVEPKLDKRLSYYKFLKSKTDFREFAELDFAGLTQWLVKTAKEQGGVIGSAEARYLIERVGANQQLLFNELEKLILYSPQVNHTSIENLTDPAPQSTIFHLLEAAFAGRTQTVLKLYAEQRALKVEPPQITAMLSWQLSILAILKTAGNRPVDEIAREAKLNPYVLRKSQTIANKLSLREIKRLVSNLLAIDIRSKSSNLDAR